MLGYDLGNDVRLVAVGFHIAGDNDCIGAELQGQVHGHGGVDPESACFIAACSYYTPATAPAYYKGFAVEL